MKKAWLCGIAAVFLIGAVAGCNRNSSNGEESPGFTTPSDSEIVNEYSFITSDPGVFVRRNGSVSSADIENFQADYYDLEEFENDYVVPAVTAYNKSRQGLSYSKASETTDKLAVAINKIALDGTALTLLLDYASASDYLDFNKEINDYYDTWETFVVCPFSELAEQGISTDVSFVDTEGNIVSADKVMATKGLYACVIGFGGEMPTDFSGKFHFQGPVAYTTSGVYIQSDNSVRVYGSENLQYILFQ